MPRDRSVFRIHGTPLLARPMAPRKPRSCDAPRYSASADIPVRRYRHRPRPAGSCAPCRGCATHSGTPSVARVTASRCCTAIGFPEQEYTASALSSQLHPDCVQARHAASIGTHVGRSLAWLAGRGRRAMDRGQRRLRPSRRGSARACGGKLAERETSASVARHLILNGHFRRRIKIPSHVPIENCG